MTEALASKLSEYDFIAVVDASGSMGTADMKGRTRWDYMQESMRVFVQDICKLDSDGIGLVIFGGDKVQSWDGVTLDKIDGIFSARGRPMGGTPLAEALTEALKLAGKSDKKDFVIVFTDGVPDDKEAAKRVILQQANKQAADDECTILFVQVGADAGATAYLKMLDDDLKGAKFDIVDAKTMAEAEAFASTAELIEHAIND